MLHFILFLHILGGVGMGFYLLLPVLSFSLVSLTGEAQAAYLRSLLVITKYARFLLIVQLITGGYLISQGKYAVGWIIAVLVLFISLGPITGNISKQLKTAVENFNIGISTNAEVSKIMKLAFLSLLVIVVILILMVYPQ